MTKINFSDTAEIGDVLTHKDGYKIVRARMARTGVQSYRRHEMGDAAPMGDPNDIIVVYRPDEEVFADEAVNGWSHVPITLDHPAELVTPDNVTKYAVGEVTNKAHVDREAGWLGLEFIVKDAASIAKIESGEYKELSGGYEAIIDFTDGVTPDGIKYDAVQRSIDPNHLALVRRGRAGSLAKIGDSWGAIPATLTKDADEMAFTKLKFGDSTVSVADADVVSFEAARDALISDHAAEIAAKDAELAAADVKVKEAEAKILTDEQINERAQAIADRAAKVKAVTDKHGEDFVKGKSEAYIDAAYDLLPANEADKLQTALADKAPVNDAADPWAAFKTGESK